MKISIVMPSLNQGRFLRSAVESILTQDFAGEVEPLIIDGGSSDNTVAILKSYGDRIRWISEPDRGQSDALNKGFAMASGDVFGWLNVDDHFYPGAFHRVQDELNLHADAFWVCGKVRVIDEQGNEQRRLLTRYKNMQMRRFSYCRLLTENWLPQMGIFWRRSAWEAVGGFREDIHLAMDYDYWLRLAELGDCRFIDAYFAAFRWHGASKSATQYVEQSKEAYHLARYHARGRHFWPLLMHRFNRIRTVFVYRLLDLLTHLRSRDSRSVDSR